MTDKRTTELTEATTATTDDLLPLLDDPGGTPTLKKITLTNFLSSISSLLTAFTGDSGSGGTSGAVPAPASGDAAALKFLKADGTWAAISGGGGAIGGRLTLTSGTPITTSDVTAATAIYWEPWISDKLPLYDGAAWSFIAQTPMTLTLNNPNHAANTIYDVFFFDDSGTKRIGTGPAWTNSGAGTSARGTGAGTTELDLYQGIYVNKNQITARNGSNTYTVSAGHATYLGSFMTTGTAAKTEDSLTNRLLWNNYNSSDRYTYTKESTNHTYGTFTWRKWNNSDTNNLHKILVGLPTISVTVNFDATLTAGAAGAATSVAIYMDGAAVPSFSEFAHANTQYIHGGTTNRVMPSAGYHYFQGYEIGSNANCAFNNLNIYTSYHGL